MPLDSAIAALAGSGVGSLIGMWISAVLQRRTSSSNRLFELRLEALTRVWDKFISTRDIVAEMVVGDPKRVPERRQQAQDALNSFRREVDQSQVVLDSSVTAVLREIDTYIFCELASDEDIPKPGVYDRKIKALLKKFEAAINGSMKRYTHCVSLSLSEPCADDDPAA